MASRHPIWLYRHAKGLSLRQLATRASVDFRLIHHLERDLTREERVRLAKVLNTTPDALEAHRGQ